MSYTSLSDTTPVARKQHRCIWCGQAIPKGEKYRYTTGVYDGDMQANHWHFECSDAQQTDARETGEYEFSPYDNERPATLSTIPPSMADGGKT